MNKNSISPERLETLEEMTTWEEPIEADVLEETLQEIRRLQGRLKTLGNRVIEHYSGECDAAWNVEPCKPASSNPQDFCNSCYAKLVLAHSNLLS